MQTSFGAFFNRFAFDEEREALARLQAGPEQKEVDRLRAIAFNAPFGGDVSSVSGPDWFAASTKRIDRLKGVEDRIAASVVSHANLIVSELTQSFWVLSGLLGALLVVMIIMSFVIARSISVPLMHLVDGMKHLAQNDTEIRIDGADRGDEIGNMARAIEVFRENAVARKRLELEAMAERDRELHRQNHLDQMVGKFRIVIDDTLKAVEGQTVSMKGTARTLTKVAQSATSDANAAEQASAGASNNVQTVATATDQMVVSVREISEQAVRANRMVNAATDLARSTNKDVASLSDAAERIGTVVGIIRDIADQTNLLALNATIASAVEEQEASTQEIAGSIQKVSFETQHAMSNAQGVASVIGETAKEAHSVELSSDELSVAAGQLAKEVERFLNDVRQDVQERRSSLRVKMSEVIAVQHSGRKVKARIVDASDMGCKLDIDQILAPSEVIQLELATGKLVSARVIWQEGSFAGLEFSERVEDLSLLRAA